MSRPSPALIIALIALFLALAGTAWAFVVSNNSDVAPNTIAGAAASPGLNQNIIGDSLGATDYGNRSIRITKVKEGDVFRRISFSVPVGFGTNTGDFKIGTFAFQTSCNNDHVLTLTAAATSSQAQADFKASWISKGTPAAPNFAGATVSSASPDTFLTVTSDEDGEGTLVWHMPQAGRTAAESIVTGTFSYHLTASHCDVFGSLWQAR